MTDLNKLAYSPKVPNPPTPRKISEPKNSTNGNATVNAKDGQDVLMKQSEEEVPVGKEKGKGKGKEAEVKKGQRARKGKGHGKEGYVQAFRSKVVWLG